MWQGQSQQAGEREEVRAGRGQGQVMQGLVSPREDLGFYPKGGGTPGGLWAEEEQDLTQVLTSTPWWLPRENSLLVGDERELRDIRGEAGTATQGKKEAAWIT